MRMYLAPISTAVAVTLALSAAGLAAQQPGQQPAQPGQQLQQNQQQTQSITGEVVQRQATQITVRTGAGQTMTFQIQADTRVMGPTGQLAAQQRQQEIEGLDPGDRVTIQYRPGMTPQQYVAVELRAVAAPTTQQQAQAGQQPSGQATTVMGQVTERSNDRVTIRTDAGQTMTFQVDNTTRLLSSSGATIATAQRNQQLTSLRVGDRMTVQYRQGTTPQQFVAVEMNLPASSAAAQPSTTAQASQPGAQTGARLPQTSGVLPLAAMLGLLGLLGAAGLGTVARRQD